MSAAVLFAAATAFVLGARHGLDWDHLTAIADLVGPTEGRRRSFALALWYCVGHGSVILLLGILVGLVGVRLPEGLDRVFEAIVGLTLVGLGLLVLVQIARQRTAYRFTSRWRLLIDLFRRVWLRSARTADRGRPREIVSPRFAFGIGVLHGTGAETPTQVVLFASAAAAGSAAGAVLVLGAFVAGLISSDTGVAMAWLMGRAGPARVPFGQLVMGVATVVGSIGVGSAFLLQKSAALPSLLGG